METKDIFYIIGISSTVILSLITLNVNLRNRRNALREHLYKEQVTFLKIMFTELNKINIEFDKIFNNPEARRHNDYQEILEKIAQIVFQHEFLLPSDLAALLKKLVEESYDFYAIQLGSNSEEIKKAYEDYYHRYYALVNYIKKFIGTDSLSSENKNLHNKANSKESELLRKVFTEAIEAVVRV